MSRTRGAAQHKQTNTASRSDPCAATSAIQHGCRCAGVCAPPSGASCTNVAEHYPGVLNSPCRILDDLPNRPVRIRYRQQRLVLASDAGALLAILLPRSSHAKTSSAPMNLRLLRPAGALDQLRGSGRAHSVAAVGEQMLFGGLHSLRSCCSRSECGAGPMAREIFSSTRMIDQPCISNARSNRKC
jgi:hypothetical protein